MKDDLISRQAALSALGERPVVWSDNDDYTLGERNQYDMDRLAIETVPSAQPGWIPTSEKLPERYDNYLITTDDEDVDIGTFHPEFKRWSICDADGFMWMDGVLAWCELPKPWEGGQNNG